MKKLLFLLALVIVAITANAQRVITESKTFRIIPTAADTITNGVTKHNYIYVKNYATKFKVQVDQDSLSGNPHQTVILRKSMDYIKWVNMDTLLMAHTTADTSQITALEVPYTPYLDIQTTGTTATGKAKLTYTILIEKNP